MAGLQLCSMDWKGSSLTGHCIAAVQHCSFCLTRKSASSKLPGLHWEMVNIPEPTEVQSFLVQKSIPHLRYQLRCEDTWHKGLTLVTALSHFPL